MTNSDTKQQVPQDVPVRDAEVEQLSLFGDEQLPTLPAPPTPHVPTRRTPGRKPPPRPGWPDPTRFPFNDPASGVTVGEMVLGELRVSRQPLIITGFTSLPLLVELLAHYQQTSHEVHVRILLGHEPTVIHRSSYRVPTAQKFSREVEDYWLNRGVSVRQSADVLAAITLLESSTVEVRSSKEPNHPIHAKIYRADHAITLGSSNLSRNGMRTQFEANRRYTVMEQGPFQEAVGLAEQIWMQGRDYKARLSDLLRQLLSAVTWQEALARACAEILDGLWGRRAIQADRQWHITPLWPAQEQGLAQAMWLIDQVGSVLVADATGSGKTRLGAEILRGMVNRLWARGSVHNHVPVVIAPPRVLESWEQDTLACNLAVAGYSHALLSSAKAKSQRHHDLVQRAQVLAIDEAHNFLNTTSNRSRALLRAAPEHTLLMTATPINREVGDLLTMINLLGPDNFDDATIKVILDAAQVKSRTPGERTLVSEEAYVLLQRAIRQFTLRRTKQHFNALIDQAPEAYRNRLGRPCRYPTTHAQFYPTGETEDDQKLIVLIRGTLDNLIGIAFIHSVLRVPDTLCWQNRTQAGERWLEQMLRGAKGLAAYHVLAALRSSRVAALEHLAGTHAAWKLLGQGAVAPLKQRGGTGDMLSRVQALGGTLPRNELGLSTLPVFLVDPDAHREACTQEAHRYTGLIKLIQAISDRREETKAQLLADLLARHPLLLAFDARPITLHDIAQRLEERGITVRIATPDRGTDSERVLREFQLGSPASGIVALCTDAMSEGINLQAASAIVHLDLPTVVRRLEQRDGRLSRMDSDHAEVESWLPKDSAAFAPRAGEEIIYRRYQMVRTLLGGNVTLPNDPDADDEVTDVTVEEGDMTTGALVTPEELVQHQTAHERECARIPDAFSTVRALVVGEQALLPLAIYDHYRTVQARVISSVAAVQTDQPWVFLCLAGAAHGAPRFALLRDETPPITGLEDVCLQLRDLLGSRPEPWAFDRLAAQQLSAALERLNADEELLLPRKKQRALGEMRVLLPTYRPGGSKRRTSSLAEDDSPHAERSSVVDGLLDLLNGERVRIGDDGQRIMPDLGLLAERWLALIHPVWEIVRKSTRSKILLLRHLRSYLRKNPLATESLEQLLRQDGLWVQPLDERVVAAIVGVVADTVTKHSTNPQG